MTGKHGMGICKGVILQLKGRIVVETDFLSLGLGNRFSGWRLLEQ